MPSLAGKRIVEHIDGHPVDPQARPEELRLLEALLFASAEPIDQATLAKRMPEGVDVKVALAQLQAETVAFLSALLARTSTLPECTLHGPLNVGVMQLPNGTRYLFVPSGSVHDVFWYQLLGVPSGQSLEPIRRCAAPDCGQLFYRVRRKQYCSTRCRNRAYMRTYRA